MSALSRLPHILRIPATAEDRSQARRLFHGRGHAYQGLHHITVDWLPPVALITLFAPEPVADIEALADRLLALLPGCHSVQLQRRYELSGPVDVIRGADIAELIVQEDALRFHVRLGKARNIGLFLDMRNGRRWVNEHCAGQRVLNLFAYTCGFSVAAVAGHAKSVLNVDMSSAALNIGRENHRLNGQTLESVRFEKLNIFNSFGRLKRRGPFDLLICDPPTFQKGSVDIGRDYHKILRRLDDFMAPHATLLLCLNAPELGRDFLLEHMTELAPRYSLVDEIEPPSVFAEAQGKGLKLFCFNNI